MTTPLTSDNTTRNSQWICYVCSKLTSDTGCGRCSCIVYCSKKCQLAHWPQHKLWCDRKEVFDSEDEFFESCHCGLCGREASSEMYSNSSIPRPLCPICWRKAGYKAEPAFGCTLWMTLPKRGDLYDSNRQNRILCELPAVVDTQKTSPLNL